ncbi:MAG: helix-turn-helix domain-containing protein [Planctomycetota bacterium]
MKKKAQSRTKTKPTPTVPPTTIAIDKTSDRLLPVCEVAERLGVSVRTVWSLRSAGEIPAPIKFGNTTRWRRSEIESHIRGLGAAGR